MMISAIRATQDAERERIRAGCNHAWETAGIAGVIVGASRCSRCGTPSRSSDFHQPTQEKPEGA